MQPILEPLVLDLVSMDCLFMLAALVGTAGHEGCLDPFQYLFVEMQPVKQVGEFLIEHFLADIFPAAITVPAPAFVGMPRAVIVDVFAFLISATNMIAAPKPPASANGLPITAQARPAETATNSTSGAASTSVATPAIWQRCRAQAAAP
ncbi:hypothetical protein FJ970_26230 [Mesorhizobium sp. B2-1-8]|nr:hypothetical protein [Mesorhizobium sp. B2-1-8]UCI18523.1 hypothetical protein FJ970_26230 [Mesorhizobium sp. B2-1-8]